MLLIRLISRILTDIFEEGNTNRREDGSQPTKTLQCEYVASLEELKFQTQLSWAWKQF